MRLKKRAGEGLGVRVGRDQEIFSWKNLFIFLFFTISVNRAYYIAAKAATDVVAILLLLSVNWLFNAHFFIFLAAKKRSKKTAGLP